MSDTAAARPDGEALVGSATRYAWADYERATRRIAHRLLAAGVQRGERVAVSLAKDARSYLAVHGVVRAGGVVVPIDPLAPSSVVRDVLADADVAAMFLDPRAVAPVDPWSIAVSQLRVVVSHSRDVDPRAERWDDEFAPDAPDTMRDDVGFAPLPEISGGDLAYIIYTSGSTGRPKGIVHTHASAMAYAERVVRHHGLGSSDRVAGMSPFHFDMSTLELYAAPLAGAAVVVIGEAVLKFPASFTARAADENVTVWYSVPSFFRQVVERGALDDRDLAALRLVMYGGEPYSAGALGALMDAVPGVEIKNIYGPAEVNECTNHRIERPLPVDGELPIGRPWDGVELRIVDSEGHSATTGELLVSAPTAMQGYWRRPDLTAGSLTPRPEDDDGPPWYATGDIVSVDETGCYWFHGRRDHQVKLRGIRIELEAVESVLCDAPAVLHAVAAPIGPPGDASGLEAVLVLREGADLDEAALRAWCSARLPAVAVPRSFSVRPSLPFTGTGKIDRRRVRSELAAESS